MRSTRKHLNDVILPGAFPELNYEILRFTQGDKAKGSG